jgi:pSer/pThr/pTyr-binding forkhead associated (FHA) protein
MYRLVFESGPNKNERLAIHQGSVLLGRGPEAHIRLDDEEVSRKHAVIEETGEGVVLSDAGSTNDIMVNGKTVKKAVLKDGDLITLGNTKLRYLPVRHYPGEETRRLSHVQGLTFAAVVFVLLAEIAFIAIIALWRPDMASIPLLDELQDEETTVEQAVAVSEEQPVVSEPAAPEPVSAVTIPAETVPSEEPAVEEVVEADTASEPATEAVEAAVISSDPVSEVKPVEPEFPAPPVDTVEQLLGDEEAVEVSEVVEDTVASGADEVAGQDEEPVADPVRARAEDLLDDARLEIRRHNLNKADEILSRIQILDPRFFKPYAERARLYETRAMWKEAGEQWAALMDASRGTPWYDYAAKERSRVAQQEARQSSIKKPAGAEPPAVRKPLRLPGRVRLDKVHRQRVTNHPEFDDMHIITMVLKPKVSRKYIHGEDVKVEITFYDREKGSDRIVPTAVSVPDELIEFSGPWDQAQRRTVNATYVVPNGYRDEEKESIGSERDYYGYVIRVFYEGQLQDREVWPEDLEEVIGNEEETRSAR